MLLANFDRKEHLQHRAVSLRQHGFLVDTCHWCVYDTGSSCTESREDEAEARSICRPMSGRQRVLPSNGPTVVRSHDCSCCSVRPLDFVETSTSATIQLCPWQIDASYVYRWVQCSPSTISRPCGTLWLRWDLVCRQTKWKLLSLSTLASDWLVLTHTVTEMLTLWAYVWTFGSSLLYNFDVHWHYDILLLFYLGVWRLLLVGPDFIQIWRVGSCNIFVWVGSGHKKSPVSNTGFT